jgi:uncharacterized membrane protein
VPTGATTSALWSSVGDHSGEYLAFLISFLVISVAWGGHHHVMRYAERSDNRLRSFNMLWLLTIVLIPFATKLLTTEGHDSLGAHALRYGFYAGLQVLASGTFIAMVHHLFSSGLQRADAPSRVAVDAYWQGAGVMLGFGLSIPVFFFTTYGWLLWIVGPVGVAQVSRHKLGRSARRRIL